MGYEIVKVVNEQNDELGWAISKDNMLKLTSIHLYESYFAVKEEVATLNKKVLLNCFWPAATDPEVKAIVDDPDFYPDQEGDLLFNDSFQRLYEACSLVAHRRAGLHVAVLEGPRVGQQRGVA
jgi:hypothetical protein